jgi:5-methyltetrahydrofolate--homocysteine methyltransferase
VVNRLVSKTLKNDFVNEIAAEYEDLRAQYSSRNKKKSYLPLEKARVNRTKIDWAKTVIHPPEHPGITEYRDMSLEVLRRYIDWGPFFIAWEMKGKFPDILEDKKAGKEASKLFDEANVLLDKIINEKLFTAHGVAGLFPANAVGDDIEIYCDESRKEVLNRFHALRQQSKKRSGQPNKAISDYIAPKETGIKDYMGAFAVTTGHGVLDLVSKYEKDNDDYNAIMIKALADRLAEAFAEYLHHEVRTKLWGYAKDEDLDNKELIRENYVGIRPAPGYPAQPDHSEKPDLFELLHVSDKTGITLTEHLAMSPASSVCGLYFAHPESQYFNLGNISRDQVADYAKRKGMNVKEIERWLGPNLAYDPD